MFVATKLAKIKHASLFVASPNSYARAAVNAIGYEVRTLHTKYVASTKYYPLATYHCNLLCKCSAS